MAEFEYFRDALTSHSFKPQPQLLTEAFFVGCFTPKFRASSLNRKTSEEPTTFAHRGDRPGKRVALLYKFALKRSEEHTSELQSLMRISYAVFCLKKKK